jgi:hypothetical protein
MKIMQLTLVLALAAGVSAIVSAADSKAIQTEARVLANLNHFANDAQKKDLQAVVDDKAATAQEKTVAQALLNVQHKVTDADKPKLQAIVDDKAAPESLKTIASVMLNLNHTPSADEKDKLKKIAG